MTNATMLASDDRAPNNHSAKIAAAVGYVQRGGVLSRRRTREVLVELLEDESLCSDISWGALFSAIKARGNDLQEVLGLIDGVMAYDRSLARQLSVRPRLAVGLPVVSLTGSGKETAKTINLSTCAAFVAASCGLAVVKPGSRATSAVSGATDILEQLGVDIVQTMDEVPAQLAKQSICFFDFGAVAPRYAGRYRARFNHFHPLSYALPMACIPFSVDAVLYGVADCDVAFSAQLIGLCGHRRGAVVSTQLANGDLVDELLPVGERAVARFCDGAVHTRRFVARTDAEELPGELRQRSSHWENATAMLRVLEGNAAPCALQAVALNAGLLLQLVGRGRTLQAAAAQAVMILRTGAPARVVERLRAAGQRRG